MHEVHGTISWILCSYRPCLLDYWLENLIMQVHVAYQTSGCIAVHDHDAVRHLKFSERLAGILHSKDAAFPRAVSEANSFLADRNPGQVPISSTSCTPSGLPHNKISRVCVSCLSASGVFFNFLSSACMCLLLMDILMKCGLVQPDTALLQGVKALIRETEAVSAAGACGVHEENTHFLNMPFYETGTSLRGPTS